MFIVIGLIAGLIYILQPIDAIRTPVEWMNTTMVEYTGVGAEWILGLFGDGEFTRFMALFVALATPGLAGLALNLIAPLGRIARVIFSILILLVSLGSFGTLEWHQALLFSLATSVVGLVLALLSGPLMEALAGFMSVTLGASQVRMLITDTPSPRLQEMMELVGDNTGIYDETTLQWISVGIALIPLILVVGWLLFRLSPGRRVMMMG